MKSEEVDVGGEGKRETGREGEGEAGGRRVRQEVGERRDTSGVAAVKRRRLGILDCKC